MCQFPWEIDSLEHVRDTFNLDSWLISSGLRLGFVLQESQEALRKVGGGGGSLELSRC